jgi:hypothetical protein
MSEKNIKTHLVLKIANVTKVCTNCNNQIFADEAFYYEEGVDKHLHSLIARQFCSDCYTKYGETKLLHQK